MFTNMKERGPLSIGKLQDCHLKNVNRLRRIVPIEFFAPQLCVHLQFHVFKIHLSLSILHVSLGYIIVAITTPFRIFAEVTQFFPANHRKMGMSFCYSCKTSGTHILKHSLMAPFPKASFSILTTTFSSLHLFLKAL